MELDDDASRLDLDRLHHWLSRDAYWALGRTREAVEQSIAGSRVMAAYREGEMVAFARAVTDATTFAWLCDVYVDPGHRGQGLGSQVVRRLVADLQRAGVRRFLLRTRDAHEVYRRLGFRDLTETDRWMEIGPDQLS